MAGALLIVEVKLDRRLTVLSSADAADEDVVLGVLQAVLEVVPAPADGPGYAELLQEEGFGYVATLDLITLQDLLDMDIAKGFARLIYATLKPPAAASALAVEEPPVDTAVPVLDY